MLILLHKLVISIHGTVLPEFEKWNPLGTKTMPHFPRVIAFRLHRIRALHALRVSSSLLSAIADTRLPDQIF